jgi:hypothetical protein
MKLFCKTALLVILGAGFGRAQSSARPDATGAANVPAKTPSPAAATNHPPIISEAVRLAFPTNFEPYTVKVTLSPDGRHFGCSYETEHPLSQQDVVDLQKWLDGGRMSLRFMNSLRYDQKRGMMVVDGRKQFLMDGGGNGAFSADGHHFAYVAMNREQQTVTKGNESHDEPVPADFVVLDGQPVSDPYFDFPAWGGPKCSADGEFWAAAAHRYSEAIARRDHQIVSFVPNQYVMLVNGVPFASIGESEPGQGLPIVFSPTGHDYAFIGWTNPPVSGVTIFHDGERMAGYSGAGQPVFSRDGKHWGFLAYRGKDWFSGPNFLVVDGRENPLPPGEQVDDGRLLMGTDDNHCLYFTQHATGGKISWWWLGQPGLGYQYLANPVLSPDGRRMACVASINQNARRMIVDGAEVGKERPQPGIPALFSPDSRHVAFISNFSVERKRKAAVVVDGVRGQPYSVIEKLTWSADSRHLAYVAKRDRWLLVTDAGEQPIEIGDGRVDRLVFSADGKHAAVIFTESGQRTRWAVADRLSDDYAAVEDLAFSPDGQHLAGVVTERPADGTSRDTVRKVVLDGVLQNEYNRVWPYQIPGQRPVQSLWWDDAGHLHYWALKDTNLLEVTEAFE